MNIGTFCWYEKIVGKTGIYPNKGSNLIYPTLGLCGEAGEVAEKVKKIMRDRGGVVSAADRQEIVKELGDVLWYIAAVADEINSSLEEVANVNYAKLVKRAEENKLHGSGDNR